MADLRKSREKKLMGVAGGIAEYTRMDPTVWRALWVLGAIMIPPLILVYIVLGIAMPEQPYQPVVPPAPPYQPQPPVAPTMPPVQPEAAPTQAEAVTTAEATVQAEAPQQAEAQPQVGAEPAGTQPQYGTQPPYGTQAPYGAPPQNGAPGAGQYQQPPYTREAYKPLTKSRDKWLAGVCGGIADYFGIDPILVRALWLVSVFFFGTGIFLYLVLAILMPAPIYKPQ